MAAIAYAFGFGRVIADLNCAVLMLGEDLETERVCADCGRPILALLVALN